MPDTNGDLVHPRSAVMEGKRRHTDSELEGITVGFMSSSAYQSIPGMNDGQVLNGVRPTMGLQHMDAHADHVHIKEGHMAWIPDFAMELCLMQIQNKRRMLGPSISFQTVCCSMLPWCCHRKMRCESISLHAPHSHLSGRILKVLSRHRCHNYHGVC